MPIKIDFVSNVSPFLRGTKDTERALDDVADALDDVVRDGDRTERELERNFREIADAAKDASRKVDRSFDDGAASLGRVRDGAREVQSEFGQNMGEALSSFRGELGDIGQIGQDTLGGLAGTVSQMGPAGIVAGAGLGVAAAAVGGITEAFTRAQEASDAAKESAYEYGLTVAEAGKFADVSSRYNELTGSIEGLKTVQDLATATGWKQVDVLNALATGKGLSGLTEAFGKGADAATLSANRAMELQGALDGTRQGFDLATDGARIQAAALYDLASSVGVATGEVDDLGNKIVTMPDGKEIVIDADTHRAYEDLDALERKKIGDKTVKVGVDSSEVDRFIRDTRNRVVRVKVEGYAAGALRPGRSAI